MYYTALLGMGTSINQVFFVSARTTPWREEVENVWNTFSKQRAQNRSVYWIHEDSSTALTPQSRKKTINRGDHTTS